MIGESPATPSRVPGAISPWSPPSDARFLLLGKPGTGKGLSPLRLHRISKRKDRTFVTLIALPFPQTLEIECRHEEGAFIRGRSARRWALELVDKGTLTLLSGLDRDPSELQPKLLRVLRHMNRKAGGIPDD